MKMTGGAIDFGRGKGIIEEGFREKVAKAIHG